MGKSRAKKIREKMQREGKRSPELSRSPFAFTDMRTRKTKTKKDMLYRTKHKNQLSKDGRDGSFYFGYKNSQYKFMY
ncbi:hypothetical protein E3U55_14195 [Filobacillus milosensis]|uniref:Uncharacterized protein n=1 Tax=Filobacillus milosensis TaxID=94137 RepID=A0A4Y8IE34_9BACI|nr:hypothetical protein [Filobacillus milosensis]TFB14196.1 hypothetical protein E3U55_14195 [Filobacillus milosensis]